MSKLIHEFRVEIPMSELTPWLIERGYLPPEWAGPYIGGEVLSFPLRREVEQEKST